MFESSKKTWNANVGPELLVIDRLIDKKHKILNI